MTTIPVPKAGRPSNDLEWPAEWNRYAIDLPNPHDPEGEWVNFGYYETRAEADEAAARFFGAEEGTITIVSQINEGNSDG